MALKHLVENVSTTSPGIFSADLTHDEVESLGTPAFSLGENSVVLIRQGNYELNNGTLSLNPREALVANIGSKRKTIIIDVGIMSESDAVTDKKNISTTIRSGSTSNPKRADDFKFVTDLNRYFGNGSDLAKLGTDLLATVRKNFDGYLVEGNARKFVNAPENFFAFTIQHRDKSIVVHMKGKPEEFASTHFELKRDRTSYSRFKVAHPDDLEPALALIMCSGEKYGTSKIRRQ